MAVPSPRDPAVIVPFHAAIRARVAKATFTEPRPTDCHVLAYVSEFGAYFEDADASHVPVRIAKAAWTHCRQAVAAFGPRAGMSVRYGTQRGDCRELELVLNGTPIGDFSILDGLDPRSAADIARDLQLLVNSWSQ